MERNGKQPKGNAMKKLIVLLAAAAMIAGMSGCVCTSQCEKA